MKLTSRSLRPLLPHAIAVCVGFIALVILRNVIGPLGSRIGTLLILASLAYLGYGIAVQLRGARARIELQPPVRTGRELTGRILTGIRTPLSNVQVRLRCIDLWDEDIPGADAYRAADIVDDFVSRDRISIPMSRKDEYRQRFKGVLFEQTLAVPNNKINSVPSGFTIPISFDLPPGLPATGFLIGHEYRWELDATAETIGPDFSVAFDIAVG